MSKCNDIFPRAIIDFYMYFKQNLQKFYNTFIITPTVLQQKSSIFQPIFQEFLGI